MSTFLTNKWMDDVKTNIPKCPACGGEVEYGYFVSKEEIRFAKGLEGNKFVGLEEPLTGPFKKPLGVAISRCPKCRLFVTLYP